MTSAPQCCEGDLFSKPTEPIPTRLVLEIRGIAIEPSKMRLKERKSPEPAPPNYHIPSFKNSKRWVTKDPRGKPLKRPMLISSPEFQRWKEKVVSALESQCYSVCQTECGGTPPERWKLLQMLSRLPADDSVNDLTEGSWKVELCAPGEEGAEVTITRIR